MDHPEFHDIEAAIQKLAAESDARVASYVKESGLPEEQAKKALRALEGLRATQQRIRELCGSANFPGSSDIETLAEKMSLGQAFLAGSEATLIEAIDAARRGDFLSAFGASVRVIRELDISFDLLAREARQDKSSRAANVRHLVDQRRKAEAKELFLSRGWRFKADAARAIENTFHVTYKTAERWIGEWTRPNPHAT